MVESPLSGYVCLRVGERRFIGTWQAVQNIIVIQPRKLLRQSRVSFVIPVNHLELDETPNRFPAVEFYPPSVLKKFDASRKVLETQPVVLHIIDTLEQVPAKPIRQYRADTAELSDAHVNLLVMAIVTNGCCKEPAKYRRNQNMYRM